MSISNEISQELSLLESDLIRLNNEYAEVKAAGDPNVILPEISMAMERTYDRIQEIKMDYVKSAITMVDEEKD